MDYGQRELEIGLSRKKLIASGKPATIHTAQEEEVAAELAELLFAGLVAEEFASEVDPSPIPSPSGESVTKGL